MASKDHIAHMLDFFNQYPAHWVIYELLGRKDDARFNGYLDIFVKRYKDIIIKDAETFDAKQWVRDDHTQSSLLHSRLYIEMTDRYLDDIVC